MADEISTPVRNIEREKYGEYLAMQDADTRTELEVENILLNTMLELRQRVNITDLQDLWSTAHLTIGALEYSKNILIKYVPQNSDIMLKINSVIEELNEGNMDVTSIIDMYSPLKDEILTVFANLGFRKAKNPTYKWVHKMIDRTQIEPDAKFVESVSGRKNPVAGSKSRQKGEALQGNQSKLRRFTKIVSYSIMQNKDKRDALILVTGDRGSGKTRCALRLAYHFKKETGRKFSLKNDVVYTEADGLAKRLMSELGLIIVIDEGYFVAKNIDVLKRQVKDLADTLSAVRNRGHVVIINFIKFNRASKTILEIVNYWIHKPAMDWGILYIRDREFIGDDPWSVEDLLKAKYPGKKRWLMKHNPNYMVTLKIRKLPDKIFLKYEQYKLEAQEAKANKDAGFKETTEQKNYVITSLLEDYKKKLFDINNAGFYIESTYKIPRRLTTSLVNSLKERIGQEELYMRIKADRGIEPTSTPEIGGQEGLET